MKCGVVDRPDGKRKLHGQPVPLWGGVAVYAATAIGLAAALLDAGAPPPLLRLSAVWMAAAGIVCLVGGIDDCFELSPRVKLALQIVSVLPIILCGYSIDRIVVFGWAIEFGWVGIPLTVLWLLGCINALNLLDGMDGLASIVGLSTAAMMGMIAANLGHGHVAAMAMILAAALAGFLVYNLPPASVFLGDSGSMVIGLSVGMLGMQGTLKTSATLAITAPAVVMTLPLFDVAAAIVRRRLSGRRIDLPDRLHIHHRLLKRGWTPWQVLYLLGTICLLTGAAATAATIFRRDALAWIAAMTLVVLMIRLRLFGHHEFALAKRAATRILKSAARSVLWGQGPASGDQGSAFSVQRSRLRTRETGRWSLAFRLLGGSRGRAAGTLQRELQPSRDTVLMLEPRPAAPDLWDRFVRDLLRWDLRQAEFRATRGDRLRRVRWIDPRALLDEPCRWSLSVSVPGRDGEVCQLLTAGPRPHFGRDKLTALTLLLKSYGNQFAVQTDELFGPPVHEKPADERSTRKAA